MTGKEINTIGIKVLRHMRDHGSDLAERYCHSLLQVAVAKYPTSQREKQYRHGKNRVEKMVNQMLAEWAALKAGAAFEPIERIDEDDAC